MGICKSVNMEAAKPVSTKETQNKTTQYISTKEKFVENKTTQPVYDLPIKENAFKSFNSKELKKINNNKNNTIKMKIKIQQCDVNKATKILYNLSGKRSDCDMKELNESNTELFINGKKYKYKSFFIPEKEGLYEIQLNIKILMKNCCCLFYNCSNLQNVDLSSFNAQNVTNMSYMFYNCSNLQNVDLSSFNAQNVTNIHGMFYKCSNLKSLDLSSFNAQNVTDMSCMFSYCSIYKMLIYLHLMLKM